MAWWSGQWWGDGQAWGWRSQWDTQGWSEGWSRRRTGPYNQHCVPQPALPPDCVLTAWVPYLGHDFGGDTWFDLQRAAEKDNVRIKCLIVVVGCVCVWMEHQKQRSVGLQVGGGEFIWQRIVLWWAIAATARILKQHVT